MMLKATILLFFMVICAALALDDNEALESRPQAGPLVIDPQADDTDLKTDSTFWGYYRYPIYRRSYHVPYYRRRYYYPYTYWNSYW